jgi:hypothetical protein
MGDCAERPQARLPEYPTPFRKSRIGAGIGRHTIAQHGSGVNTYGP